MKKKRGNQPKRISPQFYSTDTLSVARQLLGKLLVRSIDGERISGVIVEVEAYLSAGDPASHSSRGQNKRNAAMFMSPGTLYVYSIHARHCLNVVAEPEGSGAAVLIRSLQPWEGIDRMRVHRQREALRDLCTGPARLCQSLAVNLEQDKTDLISSRMIWIEESPTEVANGQWTITSSFRIGITKAQDLPYRFFVDGHDCVSGLARLHKSHQAKWRW